MLFDLYEFGFQAIFALFVVGIGVLVYMAWKREQQRREAIARLALERGWQFAHRDDRWIAQLRGTFPVFRAGDGNRQCRNVVQFKGPRCDHLIMDFRYDVRRSSSNSSNNTTTYHRGVAIARLDRWLPSLELSSESFLSRMGGALGFRGIEVESAEFNRRFRIQADDRTHAFDILHPQAMEFLMAQRLDEWHLADGMLLVSCDRRWTPEDYDIIPRKLEAFVGMIPGYVWSKHSTGGHV